MPTHCVSPKFQLLQASWGVGLCESVRPLAETDCQSVSYGLFPNFRQTSTVPWQFWKLSNISHVQTTARWPVYNRSAWWDLNSGAHLAWIYLLYTSQIPQPSPSFALLHPHYYYYYHHRPLAMLTRSRGQPSGRKVRLQRSGLGSFAQPSFPGLDSLHHL